MRRSEPFGNKAIQRLPNRIFGRKQKHSFGGVIKEDNVLLFINADNGIPRRTDYARKLLPASAQFLFCLLALGYICNRDKCERSPVGFLDDSPGVTEDSTPSPSTGATLTRNQPMLRCDHAGQGHSSGAALCLPRWKAQDVLKVGSLTSTRPSGKASISSRRDPMNI